MSGEVRAQTAPQPHIECLDRQDGKELLLSTDFAAVLELPALLEPELGGAIAVADAGLQENLTIMARSVETTHSRATDLEVRDSYYFKTQQAIKGDVISDLRDFDGRFPSPYARIRGAISRIVPEEVDYLTELVRTNKTVTDEDYLYAGQLDQVSMAAKIRGKAPRLTDDTQENLDEMHKIFTANCRLSLLEGHRQATSVLSMCLAFGSRRQVSAAISMFHRLRSISCNQEWDIGKRMMEHDRAAQDVIRLADTLLSGTILADEDIQQYIRTRIDSFAENTDMRLQMEQSLAHTLEGRVFRLFGKHPEPEPVVEPVQEQPAKPIPAFKPETPKPEPRPDHLGRYRGALQEIVASADFKQFELLTTKEAKRRGLDEARAVLVKGEYDGDGNLLVGGRSKPEAHRYVSIVEFLRTFITEAGSLAEAKDALETAVEASTDYEKRLREMVAEASGMLTNRELNTLIDAIPDIAILNEIVSYIRDDWNTASFVIGNYWPGNQGKVIAEELRQLLFLSRDEIDEATSEKTEAQVITETEFRPESSPDDPIELRPDDDVII